ncbi:hypothetical protein BH11MYX1_BH11MYX1_47820 [soil metagenome]
MDGQVLVVAVARGVDGSSSACGGGGICVRTNKIVNWLEATTGTPTTKDACAARASSANSDSGSSGAAGSPGLALAPLALLLTLRRRRR